MRRRIFAGVAAVLAIAALAFGIAHYREEARYDRLVSAILETPQRYDGSAVGDLAEMGAAAVGAIGRALSKGVEFPSTLVQALERIGSERGMRPLLEFLEKEAQYSEDNHALTHMTILAFRGVGNRDACEPLWDVFRDEAASPRTKLYAARSIVYLCKTEEARDFILDEYHRHDGKQTVDSAQGYTYGEVVVGLMDINDEETEALLVQLLQDFYFYPLSVVEHLATRSGPAVVETLLNVAENKAEYEFPSRLAAVRGLIDRNTLPKSVLLPITADLASEAEEQFGNLPPQFASRIADQWLAEARRLRAQVESQ